MEVSNLIFALCLGMASFLFGKNVLKVRRNIMLGRDIDRSDRSSDRWITMARVALGQSKMVVRPVAGFLHILVYVGFVIINIEVLEIVILIPKTIYIKISSFVGSINVNLTFLAPFFLFRPPFVH